MENLLDEIRQITLADLEAGHDIDHMMRNTSEELGEFAKAVSVEDGHKKKELVETSRQEGVDVVICALALFYARGGTNDMLMEYAPKKLAKWKARLGK